MSFFLGVTKIARSRGWPLGLTNQQRGAKLIVETLMCTSNVRTKNGKFAFCWENSKVLFYTSFVTNN